MLDTIITAKGQIQLRVDHVGHDQTCAPDPEPSAPDLKTAKNLDPNQKHERQRTL